MNFFACAAATLGDAQGDSISGPKKIIMKLHATRRHASATQSPRVLVDSDGGMFHSANHVDKAFGEM